MSDCFHQRARPFVIRCHENNIARIFR
jgi:hypothetical protein